MNRYLLLLVSLILFSCSKDEDSTLSKNQVLSAECFKDIVPTGFSQGCSSDSIYHCEVTEYQDEIPISNEDREWLKIFCLNDFDKIYFHDEEGNETFLEIAEKRFLTMYRTVGIDTCADGRFRAFCVKTEQAQVEIRVPIASTTFNLGIRNNLNVQENGDIVSNVMIEAYTINSFLQSTLFINHLNVIPEAEFSFGQEFFSEIEILDKTFNNVYTSNDSNLLISRHPDAIKIFYNKEFGIVSFIDNNGTQWVLND